jgi:uncharacterized protein
MNVEIISDIASIVKQKFEKECSGHDWWHIYRVWQLSKIIAKQEDANTFIVEAAALLHDIADWKFNDGDEKAGGKAAHMLLSTFDLSLTTTDTIIEIIDNVSYKGAGIKNSMKSIEGKIVQDADRLDAIGAIGIARTFAYGGHMGRSMYDPAIKPILHNSFEEYKMSESNTINHFYEKLLLLKDLMNTETARKIADERHLFMENFLAEFYHEWNLTNTFMPDK